MSKLKSKILISNNFKMVRSCLILKAKQVWSDSGSVVDSLSPALTGSYCHCVLEQNTLQKNYLSLFHNFNQDSPTEISESFSQRDINCACFYWWHSGAVFSAHASQQEYSRFNLWTGHVFPMSAVVSLTTQNMYISQNEWCLRVVVVGKILPQLWLQ